MNYFFKVKDWPKEDYGKFFSGDSYIILNTYKDKESDEVRLSVRLMVIISDYKITKLIKFYWCFDHFQSIVDAKFLCYNSQWMQHQFLFETKPIHYWLTIEWNPYFLHLFKFLYYHFELQLLYDVHFWIGKESSQDEYGTAAYKTVELDTFVSSIKIFFHPSACSANSVWVFFSLAF